MSAQFCADVRSCVRLSADFLISRFSGLMPPGYCEHVHQVRFHGDINICYRVNKGDLHSIREIWFEEAYRLPFDAPAGVLLDLGANIGMTSIWLSRKYRFTEIIAVEPDPRNVALLRRNLDLNKVNSHVFEAAIGPREGTARFEFNQYSNVGGVCASGSEVVLMISVNALSQKLGVAKWGLIKIDIEGSEADLLESSTDWLDHARAIIIEFHPQVDGAALIQRIASRGWKYISASSVFPGNMDSFVRFEEP